MTDKKKKQYRRYRGRLWRVLGPFYSRGSKRSPSDAIREIRRRGYCACVVWNQPVCDENRCYSILVRRHFRGGKKVK